MAAGMVIIKELIQHDRSINLYGSRRIPAGERSI